MGACLGKNNQQAPELSISPRNKPDKWENPPKEVDLQHPPQEVAIAADNQPNHPQGPSIDIQIDNSKPNHSMQASGVPLLSESRLNHQIKQNGVPAPDMSDSKIHYEKKALVAAKDQPQPAQKQNGVPAPDMSDSKLHYEKKTSVGAKDQPQPAQLVAKPVYERPPPTGQVKVIRYVDPKLMQNQMIGQIHFGPPLSLPRKKQDPNVVEQQDPQDYLATLLARPIKPQQTAKRNESYNFDE